MTDDPDQPRAPKPKDHREGGGLSDRAANIIVGVVTAVWAASVVAGMFKVNGYQPSEGVNTIFMVVVGGAFVLRYKARGE